MTFPSEENRDEQGRVAYSRSFGEGQSGYDSVKYKKVDAEIKDDKGNVVFVQKDCEFPENWSQLAINIVASKYFHGDKDGGERESSAKELVRRVAKTIADWGFEDGYLTRSDADSFENDIAWLCLNQYAAFNSPVWFNVGLWQQYGIKSSSSNYRWNPETNEAELVRNGYEFPQASACFIQSLEDTMESIMELARSEAMLFKYGSGTGTDLSVLRSSKEKLSGGGKPSGPLSFLRVYDTIAGTIKSGGVTRRSAKMNTLRDWHPDIVDFIECKAKEEAKAHALIRQGYDSSFNGEAYSTVAFQNANLSVRLSDKFMEAALNGDDWWTKEVSTGKPVERHNAKELLMKIAENAWKCGDPGVQYEDTMQAWNTVPNTDRINCTNPCSEFVHIDDTACNLASLNLVKFYKDGVFDFANFRKACSTLILAQEILVGRASYPTKKIAERSYKFRPLGLGYANLGCLLMRMGLPYDSDKARTVAGAITAVMHGQALLTSSEIARVKGPFEGYRENETPYLNVINMHNSECVKLAKNGDWPEDPKFFNDAELESFHVRVSRNALKYGLRNSQVTVIAPTGTISFMMDCDTTGIEPDIALVKYKNLAGGGFLKIVNQNVPVTLGALGYNDQDKESIVKYIEDNETIEGCPQLKEEHLPIFDCAFKAANGKRSIHHKGHLKMMEAVQPFISGAISKTVNMPNDATPQDIFDVYVDGWRMGLKAVAVYRDGSKGSQPLVTSSDSEEKSAKSIRGQNVKDEKPTHSVRRKLPDTRNSLTHKFDIQGNEGYITVGLYEDGTPGELFVTMAKEGSTVGGLMDALGTSVSIALQYGVPMETLVNKFTHSRFEPSGFTKNPDIPIAKSITDYIFRWLGIRFVNGYKELNSPDRSGQESEHGDSPNPAGLKVERLPMEFSDSPGCGVCGTIMARSGVCYRCPNCGNTTGCG